MKLSCLGIMIEIRSCIEGYFKRMDFKYYGFLMSKEDIVFFKSDK